MGKPYVILSWALLLSMAATSLAAERPEAHGPLALVGRIDAELDHDARSHFDRDASRFVARSGDAVRVWDAKTLQALTKRLDCVPLKWFRLSQDGTTVLTAGGSVVRIWKVSDSSLVSESRLEGSQLRFADISPDGSRFVTITEQARDVVSVWRVGEDKPSRELRHRPEGPVMSAQFDGSGERIVSHLFLRSFHLWSVNDGRPVCDAIASDDDYALPYEARISPAGTEVVVPQRRGFLVLDCATGRMVTSVTLRKLYTTDEIRFDSIGRRVSLVLEEFDKKTRAYVYDPRDGTLQAEFGDGVRFCELLRGGKLAICDRFRKGAGDRAEVWDIEGNKVLQSFDERFVEVGPDGLTALFRAADGATAIYRLVDPS